MKWWMSHLRQRKASNIQYDKQFRLCHFENIWEHAFEIEGLKPLPTNDNPHALHILLSGLKRFHGYYSC